MDFWKKVNFEAPNCVYTHPLNIQYMFILSIHLLILVLSENFEFGPHIFHIGIIISKFSIILILPYKYFFNEIETFGLGWYAKKLTLD
jgi:hypothetical protein